MAYDSFYSALIFFLPKCLNIFSKIYALKVLPISLLPFVADVLSLPSCCIPPAQNPIISFAERSKAAVTVVLLYLGPVLFSQLPFPNPSSDLALKK